MTKPKNKSQADTADKYDLYQRSVQEPSCEVVFFNRVFRKRYGRKPLLLREDFCGTAAVCCEWVKSRSDRRAIGVDLDPEPIQWCIENNFKPLTDEQRQRIEFRIDDVRTPAADRADILAAQNFSFFCFQTRDALRGYFQAARNHLADEGLFVLDMMGGSETLEEDRIEKSKKDGFVYQWEQKRFDPITHHCKYHIHFKFPDGSKMKKAFTYEWRMWMIPEVTELLLEAGFSEAEVYWEGTDKNGEGDGVFRKREHADSDPSWIAYLVGVK